MYRNRDTHTNGWLGDLNIRNYVIIKLQNINRKAHTKPQSSTSITQRPIPYKSHLCFIASNIFGAQKLRHIFLKCEFSNEMVRYFYSNVRMKEIYLLILLIFETLFLCTEIFLFSFAKVDGLIAQFGLGR